MSYQPIEQPYYHAPHSDPDDPLVTPPGAGVPGWVTRISATFKRSWRSVLSIIFVVQVVPALVLYLLAGGIAAGLLITRPDLLDRPFRLGSPGGLAPEPTIGFGVTLAVLGVTGLLLGAWTTAVGWAATAWAVVREASTGRRAGLGEALRYGVRRSLSLWGWTLLGMPLLLLGLVACVLPVFYVIFGLAMLAPVVIFERRGIGASFRALHRNPLVVGLRVVLVWGAAHTVSSIAGLFFQVPFVTVSEPVTLLVLAAVLLPLQSLLLAPLFAFQIVATLLTYAEQRALSAPLSTAQLAADLG